MPAILPALIFLGGSVLIPVLKGRARQIYLIVIGLFGLVDVLLLQIQTSWKADFIGFDVIFLQADRISLFVGYIFVIIGFFAILYTVRVGETWHHLLAFWYVGSSLGAVFAGDLLTFYLFWEIMAVASAGLIFLKDSDQARGAGYRYLLMHLIGGAILIGGIFVHYMQTQSLAIGPMEPGLAFALVLFGVGMNAAFVLLHTWLPDSYPNAPFTASVFMSVYTTKTAVYALVRFAPGWDFVAYMGAAMAVFGVTMALVQGNARKLLSYHIVSQVGYMVAAIGLGGALGIDAALFHLFNHILYKALLFMTIGALIYRLGTDELTELGGVWKKMPITTISAIVASLSISGAPLFNGFASKALIFQGAESKLLIEMMLELAAVGTFLSFLKFTYFGFLRSNKKNEAIAKEVPLNMSLAMGGTAILCVAIGVAPQLIVDYLPFALPATQTNIYTFARAFGVSQIGIMSTILFALALTVFTPHRRITYDFDWFYIQAGRGLQVVAEGVNLLNQGFEKATTGILNIILLLKKPIARINEFASRLTFAFLVDMWLYKRITPTVKAQREEEGIAAAEGSSEKKNTSGGGSSRFFDLFITLFAAIGEALSQFSGLFDKYVIDGIVNAIGWLTLRAGKKIRPIQTGDVQNYGYVMVAGAIVIIFVFGLAFFGVIKTL